MVSDENAAPSETPQAGRREPLSPAQRKRLQKLFEHASKQMAQENYDYATNLFGECVLGDPSNLIYMQNYVGNLQRKYKNNKSGSRLSQFKELGARSALRKALSHSQWDDVIKHGLKILAVNPWDVSALTAMATAAENSGDEEIELFYLKSALDVNSKDPAVNRQCALALSARQQFDQAIACWRRVELAKPGDEEAQREISRLAVERTIIKGGYEDKDEARKLAGDRKVQPQLAPQPQQEVSAKDRLRRAIDQDRTELSNYFELAQVYLSEEDYQSAEEILAKAVEVSGGDANVRERWEDAQLRHLRQQMVRAPDDDARKKVRRILVERELEVFAGRIERYPNNLGLRYDLAYRYQLLGQYTEAIKEYQQARNDPHRRGESLLRLGQCFEHIKQHPLAMKHYESALKEIPERDEELRKETLHRAGRLATATGDLDAAEGFLTSLAEIDFGYKDVSTLLDKIAELRNNT